MNIIGIDSGSSITKIIETNEKGKILNRLIINEKDTLKALNTFIEKFNIDIGNIFEFVVTGVGASNIHEDILNTPTIIVDEFLAIGEGGTYLSKKSEVLVVSVGTGTAFVKCNNRKI